MKKCKNLKPHLLSRPIRFLVFTFLILSFAANGLVAENTPVKKANYKLAARFTSAKMQKMAFSTSVSAHWLKHSDRFWYTYETSEGKTFYIVNPVRKTKRPLFDNVKMAAELTLITKDPYDAKHLPIDRIKFVKKDRAIQFEVESSQEEKEEPEKKEDVEKKNEKIEKEKEKEEEKAPKKTSSRFLKTSKNPRKGRDGRLSLRMNKPSFLPVTITSITWTRKTMRRPWKMRKTRISSSTN
jgi:hypothetical protein